MIRDKFRTHSEYNQANPVLSNDLGTGVTDSQKKAGPVVNAASINE